MPPKVLRAATVLVLAGSALLTARNASARGWDKIPKEQQALQSVPWAPAAPAVVLFHHTAIVLSEKGFSCRRDEHVRLKILSEEGKEYGTVPIWSSEYDRLRDLKARTVTPDGTEVALPKDAVFEKKYSDYYRQQITSFAMPDVQVGSIIEYKFSIYFDTALTTWEIHMQGELPIVDRQVRFEKPHRYEFNANYVDPRGIKPERYVEETAKGLTVTYSSSNLAPIPDEPFRPPFVDLSTRVQFVPRVMYLGAAGTYDRTWENMAKVYQKYIYKEFWDGSRRAQAKARELVANLAGEGEKAGAVYRFVRDQITTTPSTLIVPGETTSDQVIEAGRGTPNQKALLLHQMLAAVEIEAALGWTNPRTLGAIQTEFPGTIRLSRTLVILHPGGERIFLDAADRDAAFGYLGPDLEDVLCLLLAGEVPKWIRTPLSPPEASRRVARVDLAVEESGRVTGSGKLQLTGHHAWVYLNWKDTAEATATAWKEWLADRYPGYDIGDVAVTESVDDGRIDVSWTLAQRDEEVLGDEASILLSAPLSLKVNPFTLDVGERATSISLRFPDAEEVETHVQWPESWQVDIKPRPTDLQNWAGEIVAEISIDGEARTLTAKRTFVQEKREVQPNWVYGELKKLYEGCVLSDAESLVLARQP